MMKGGYAERGVDGVSGNEDVMKARKELNCWEESANDERVSETVSPWGKIGGDDNIDVNGGTKGGPSPPQ